MTEEKRRILNMLEEGKLTAQEAATLLDQLGEKPAGESHWPEDMIAEDTGKMLRVRVHVKEDGNGNPVNVSINLPLKVARLAGKLISVAMPKEGKDALHANGVDLSELDLVELIDALGETGGDIVNVMATDEKGEQVMVRVYVG